MCDIQKGISPNGDAYNEYFDLADFNVENLIIFNRYGREVYEKSHYITQWHVQDNDGDELPTGTYYDLIRLADESGY
jgi:gliding motility-associated-like protein